MLRVALSAGKVFYDLDAHRREAGDHDTALVRIEQLYPFPAAQVKAALARYPAATDVVWVQEEPRNMGAWEFLDGRLAECLADRQALRYAGRPRSGSPATGSFKRHLAEQRALVLDAFGAVRVASPASRTHGS